MFMALCGQDVADNQIDTGDLMECLVQNKHQKEMNDKCSVGVTHFQLVSLHLIYATFSAFSQLKKRNFLLFTLRFLFLFCFFMFLF